MIRLDHVYKGFNGNAVLEDISLALPEKGFCAITGRSGRGKTTLLYLIAGLYKPDRGSIQRNGETISMVFQEDRLCGNLTAAANVRLVCGEFRSAGEISEAFAAVGLSGCENRLAVELSGGMKRRVALVRALLAEGGAVLLDEPFKGLDESTKRQAVEFSREMLRGRTAVLVTHDRTEAVALADEVIEL